MTTDLFPSIIRMLAEFLSRANDGPDRELIALLPSFSAALDDAVKAQEDGTKVEADAAYYRVAKVAEKITAAQVQTLDGYRVKAAAQLLEMMDLGPPDVRMRLYDRLTRSMTHSLLESA